MFNCVTCTLAALLLLMSSSLSGQGNEFNFGNPFEEIPSTGPFPLPTIEEAKLVGSEIDQLNHMRVELTESLGVLQDQAAEIEANIQQLEKNNQTIDQDRNLWRDRIEALVAENDMLLSETQGFDPIQEEMVANNRSRLQELEQACRKGAQQIEKNQQQIQQHWITLNEHEQNIMRHEELLRTCQLLIAMQEE